MMLSNSNPSLIVLDTSVVSILMRERAEAAYYGGEVEGRRAVVCFQTFEELWFGAIRNDWSERRRNQLRHFLDQFDVVWASPEMVEISASLRSNREKNGQRLNTADAWIAATAIMLGCPLASHDGDFVGIPGLYLIRAPTP